MKPLAIIGLDPGTTTGYAVLDLQGGVMKTYSAKELPLSRVIADIMERCHPVIVSTDKAKVPSFVEEFARKTGTEVVSPELDLQREEKRDLLKECRAPEKLDSHEQDGVAAAYFAYKKYLPRLDKIDTYIQEHQLEEHTLEFTQLALKGELHFSLLQKMVTQPAIEPAIITRVVQEDRITKSDFLRLFEKLGTLQQDQQRLIHKNMALQEQVKKLQKENRYLERKSQNFTQRVDSLFTFKEERVAVSEQHIQEQQKMMEKMNQKILELYRFMERVPALRLVKKLHSLSKVEFAQKNEVLNIQENDVLWVEKPYIYSEELLTKHKV